jgi:MoxR-like ATPase
MGIKISIKEVKKTRSGTPIGEDLPSSVRESVEKFNNFFGLLKKRFIDRDDELEQIKYALLTQEHILLKGKPGTAKSQLGRSVFSNITGATNFEVQLSKFMSEDYLFGPINVKKLREEGEIVHNTKNTIVDSNFAFIDEFFDGSDVLLRSLLEILNERTFTRNTQKEKCPLHTAILTSNYSREEESTEAILDRILFKSDVSPIGTATGRMRMYKNALVFNSNGHVELDAEDQLALDTLKKLVRFIKSESVTVSETVLGLYDSVLKEYVRQTTKYVSDRTAVKMLKLLKSVAVVHGRTMVLLEDIPLLKYSICMGNDHKDQQVWEAIVYKQISDRKKSVGENNTLSLLLKEVEEVMTTKFHKKKEFDGVMKIRKLQEVIDKINDAAGKFEVDNSKQEASKMMEQVRTNIEAIKQQVGEPGMVKAGLVLDSADGQQVGDPFAKGVLAGIIHPTVAHELNTDMDAEEENNI